MLAALIQLQEEEHLLESREEMEEKPWKKIEQRDDCPWEEALEERVLTLKNSLAQSVILVKKVTVTIELIGCHHPSRHQILPTVTVETVGLMKVKQTMPLTQ